MLKVIHSGNAMPLSMPVSSTAEFQPGYFGQLGVIGNDTAIFVSDGLCPIGIIDDTNVSSFTKPQIDEIIQIKLTPDQIIVDGNGKITNAVEVSGILENPHIIQSSFISDISVFLNYVNGIITIPVGTECNFDYDENGINDGYKVLVNYIYRIANKPGDSTVASSGRVTLHYQRGIYATDQYDTTCVFALNCTLYVNLSGVLTSTQPTSNHPAIALATGIPNSAMSTLEFLLL